MTSEGPRFERLHHAQLAMPRRWDGDFPGFRRVNASDPFGNRLEFLEPVD